jgi:hypothetical protein
VTYGDPFWHGHTGTENESALLERGFRKPGDVEIGSDGNANLES